MKKTWNIAMMIAGMVMTAFSAGCSMIDEDRSECETEKETIDYELRLITNITTEIHTKLGLETEVPMAHALREHLKGIFTDFAHDVNLSFYDTLGDSVRLYHNEHIMDASQESFTLTIPRQKYMHLAVANIINNPHIDLLRDEWCHKALLSQTGYDSAIGADADTVNSHNTGLFTARQLMEMKEGIDQHFNVRLYMANCAVALVVDPCGFNTEGMKVFTTGFATGFNIADSTFQYSSRPPVVRTERIDSSDGQLCFCSVNYPSRYPAVDHTRTVIEAPEEFDTTEEHEALWQIYIYLPHDNGKITRTILHIKRPLEAGELMIIPCRLSDYGEVEPESNEVSTSVTLDWQEGLVIGGNS